MSENASPILYTNKASVDFSQNDFVVSFFVSRPPREDTPSPDQSICTLHMSPHHAKALSLILAGMVARFEATCGELKVKVPPMPEAKEGKPK